jgi:hypothetical protein
MQDSVLPADISHLHLSPLLLLCGFSWGSWLFMLQLIFINTVYSWI